MACCELKLKFLILLFALKLEHNDAGDPEAYLVYVWNLQEGDEVTVSFSRYTEEGTSVLIWGHWNDELPGDPDAVTGDAGGNDDAGMAGAYEEPAEGSGFVRPEKPDPEADPALARALQVVSEKARREAPAGGESLAALANQAP